MSLNESMSSLWDEVKQLVDAAEVDLQKQLSGTASAGPRFRKATLALRAKLKEVKDQSVSLEKERRSAKKAAKAVPESA